jgi:hypothetical protein
VLSRNGILLVTTHGCAYENKLAAIEKKWLQENGIVTQSYPQPGRRMLATYHTETAFRKLVDSLFEVLEYYDGKKDPRKAGGQDLWILKKI